MHYEEKVFIPEQLPYVNPRSSISFFEVYAGETKSQYAKDFVLPRRTDKEIVCIDNYFFPYNSSKSDLESLGITSRNDRRIVWVALADLIKTRLILVRK